MVLCAFVLVGVRSGEGFWRVMGLVVVEGIVGII